MLEERYQLDWIKKQNMIKQISFLPVDGSKQIYLGIQRLLGHSKEIPTSGMWKFITDGSCWVCNYSKFALFVWSRSIGETVRQSQVQLTDQSFKDIIRLLPKIDKPNDQQPIVYTESY